MFKNTLKIFFKNLKYVVIAMAFIYLGGIFFIISTFKGAFLSISHFATNTLSILEQNGANLNFDFSELQNSIQGRNVTNIQETLANTFNSIIQKLSETSQKVADEVSVVANEAVNSFIAFFVIGIVFLIIMFVLGSVLCGVQIKKANNIKGGLKSFLLRTFLKTVVFALLIAAIAYFIQRINWAAGLCALALLIFQTLFSLYQAHIVQKGAKNVFKNITLKDVAKYIGMILLLYIIAALLILIIFVVLNDPILSILITLPIIVYIDKFIDIYAELYVVKKDDAKTEPKPIETKNNA